MAEVDTITVKDASGVSREVPTLLSLETIVLGTVAHDDVDSGNGSKISAKAVAYGVNPTGVAAADRTDLYANRAGILFTIGGHPNVISRCNIVADSDGAQTDAALVSTAGGAKIALTHLSVSMDASNTGNVRVRIGFGAANVPADALSGTAGIVLHGDFSAGSGLSIGNGSAVIAIGADGEDLRVTCEDPAGGNVFIRYSYFTIES